MTFEEAIETSRPGESILRLSWDHKRSIDINKFGLVQLNGFPLRRTDFIAKDWKIVGKGKISVDRFS